MTMIRLENVSKRYEMGDVRVTALDNISLDIDKGEFVVVLGPSGSGKTTLLNIIGALDVPTEGVVHINGGNMSLSKKANRFKFRRETVSFIFQTFNLFPSLTALENVQFVLDMANTPNSRQRALDVLKDVGLEERVTHFPHELSGGEQQRVAIARALATGNPVLLADEPTGELDFKTGIQILQLLEKQANAGKTVLVVTHNREISRIADRVIELSSGKIVRDGAPRDGKAAITDLQW
jgi:putative ABC transport system ATP-binding protein